MLKERLRSTKSYMGDISKKRLEGLEYIQGASIGQERVDVSDPSIKIMSIWLV